MHIGGGKTCRNQNASFTPVFSFSRFEHVTLQRVKRMPVPLWMEDTFHQQNPNKSDCKEQHKQQNGLRKKHFLKTKLSQNVYFFKTRQKKGIGTEIEIMNIPCQEKSRVVVFHFSLDILLTDTRIVFPVVGLNRKRSSSWRW